jgi:hypothetical protein
MDYLPPIFSLLVAAAGWFYMLHASRASSLKGFETDRDNQLRIRLRRIGGAMMIGLAVSFYVAFVYSNRPGNAILVLICMGMVLLLLMAILALAYVDIRLTRKMREAFKRKNS